MTRAQVIDRITAGRPSLDDEAIQTVAEVVESLTGTASGLPRALTPRELALIEQSKADFREGRTLSLEEARAYIDAARAERRRAHTVT